MTDYIDHMMRESALIMKGTKHEESWYLYHDSLSIMTAAKTKEWMAKKGYIQKWILPSNDLYHDDLDLKKRYSNNPLGNSPEFMPWDTHLNQDVHASHDFHVGATSHLPESHQHKFSGTTPKRMAHSYERILDPGPSGVVPSSNRINQDVMRVLESLKLVYEAKGVLVNENITGRRFVAKDNDEAKNWGGKRQKKVITHIDVPLHHHAEVESKRRIANSVDMFAKNIADESDGIIVDEIDYEAEMEKQMDL